MTIGPLILAAAAVASAVTGALITWLSLRGRLAANEELGEDKVIVARNDLADLEFALNRSRQRCQEQKRELSARETELERAGAYLQTMRKQVSKYLRQYATAKDILKKEIQQRHTLSSELNTALAENESLRARISELLAARDEGFGAGFEHASDDLTSLPATANDDPVARVEALAREVERWREHSGLLQDALRDARARVAPGRSAQLAAAPASARPADEDTDDDSGSYLGLTAPAHGLG